MSVTTLALASLAASASAAMALWSWTGSRTSLLQQRRIVRRGATVLYYTVLSLYCTHISTRSTFTPQGSVASSSEVSIHCAIFSLQQGGG